MPSYTVSFLKATNTGHRITSSTCLHTAEEAASIVNARLTEDDHAVTPSKLHSHGTHLFRGEEDVLALITAHGN